MNYGIFLQSLEADVDAALNKPGILADLVALRADAFIKKVPGVDDCLNSTRKHAPPGQVLRDGQAERRIVVLFEPLIWIEANGG